MRVGQRLGTWDFVGAILLVLFGVRTATGYVDGGRLLGDLWGLGRAVVDVVLPWLRGRLGLGP